MTITQVGNPFLDNAANPGKVLLYVFTGLLRTFVVILLDPGFLVAYPVAVQIPGIRSGFSAPVRLYSSRRIISIHF